LNRTRTEFEGVHVVATLYGCRNHELLEQKDPALDACERIVSAAGLTAVGSCAQSFGGAAGYSLAVLLAESHLAMHTWPEHSAVTLDVYTCNYSSDNTAAARKVAADLADLFQPDRTVHHEMRRDRGLLLDRSGEGHGTFVESLGVVVEHASPFQRIEVHETAELGRLLRLDDRNQCAEHEAFVYHEALVHPAAITHPSPRDVLVLGGGDGGAAAEALKHSTVETVTIVELDADVIDVAKAHLASIVGGAFSDPRTTVEVGDGAAFIARTDRRWDLVLLDLTDAEGAAEGLYGEDFIRQGASVLRPGGMLVAHVDAPFGLRERMHRHVRTLRSVFGIVRVQVVHVPIYGELAIAVCSDEHDPLGIGADEVAHRLAARGVEGLLTYDDHTHAARFALPPFVRRMLEVDDLDGQDELRSSLELASIVRRSPPP
jgi:spermidine synthase